MSDLDELIAAANIELGSAFDEVIVIEDHPGRVAVGHLCPSMGIDGRTEGPLIEFLRVAEGAFLETPFALGLVPPPSTHAAPLSARAAFWSRRRGSGGRCRRNHSRSLAPGPDGQHSPGQSAAQETTGCSDPREPERRSVRPALPGPGFLASSGPGPIPLPQGEGTQSRGEQMPESCTSHLFNSLSSMEALSFNAGYPSTILCLDTSRSHLGPDTVHKDRPQPAGLLGETDWSLNVLPFQLQQVAQVVDVVPLGRRAKSLPVRLSIRFRKKSSRSFGSFTSSPGVGGT